MRLWGAIAGIFLLTACNDMPQARRESEIEDIASDAALDATASKFSELEGRIDDLEAEKREIELKALTLEVDVSAAQAKAEDVESELAALRSEYGGHTH